MFFAAINHSSRLRITPDDLRRGLTVLKSPLNLQRNVAFRIIIIAFIVTGLGSSMYPTVHVMDMQTREIKCICLSVGLEKV